jgi:hypothetical protein
MTGRLPVCSPARYGPRSAHQISALHPPVLSLEGGCPLIQAGFRQGEIVIGMGAELAEIPSAGISLSDNDDGNALARSQGQLRRWSKETILVHGVHRAQDRHVGSASDPFPPTHHR